METRLARLVDDLQLNLPGALLGAIQVELKNTLRDFFIETNVWKEDITFRVKENVIGYPIVPENAAVPVRLMGVWNAVGGIVHYATMPDCDTIILGYAPSQSEIWTAKLALTITGDPDKEGYPIFPKWILDLYYDVILDGVLARMMSQSAKPYTNPQMASYHQKKYMSGRAQARHQSNQQNAFGGQRWRYPTFARGGSRGSHWGPPQ